MLPQMSTSDFTQIVIYLGLLAVAAPFLGKWMARALSGEKTFLTPVVGWLEALSYRLGGVKPEAPMNWKQYAGALLAFNFLGWLFVLVLQLSQDCPNPLYRSRNSFPGWARFYADGIDLISRMRRFNGLQALLVSETLASGLWVFTKRHASQYGLLTYRNG